MNGIVRGVGVAVVAVSLVAAAGVEAQQGADAPDDAVGGDGPLRATPDTQDRVSPASFDLSAVPWCDDAAGIVFVSADIFGPQDEMGGYIGSYHWRDGYIYPRSATYHERERTIAATRPGRNLYTLVPARPDGTLTQITHLSEGEVFDPEVSYDGTRILFSMRRDGEQWFHLYEIGTDGTGLVQLTDGPFNDVSGCYLPGGTGAPPVGTGRICFVSDRTGYLEEYHEERTETLWVMNGDGTGIEQLTFNPGQVFDPTVLPDGRILFSLWDAFMIDVPPLDKHETYLMTVRPDGTEERHYFGAGQYRFFNRERHSGVGLTQAGAWPDGRVLVQSELGPAVLDVTRGQAVAAALRPVFPGTTSVQIGGTTHRVHLSPLGTRSTPYPLPDGRFLFSGTLPGARDSAIYVADPETGEAELVFNDPERADFDARPLAARPVPPVLPARNPAFDGAPRFAHATPSPLVGEGRSGMTSGGRSATPPSPPPSSGRGLSDVPPSRGRGLNDAPPSRGRALSDGAASSDRPTGTARFLVVAGRRGGNPAHERALRRARYFRVIEALYTGVTTSSHTNLETRPPSRGRALSDGAASSDRPTGTARFLVVAGRRGGNPAHERALRRARYFRVIEALYTGVTTSSHTNLETRILGVVPIQPDGSAYFEAPADTPLFLEAVDAAQNRVLFEWNNPNTSVPEGSLQTMTQMAYMSARPGEVRSCYGCHAPQDETPPVGDVEALRYPPTVVARDVTDILYRRNEPDEYRTSARVGEADYYAAWLDDANPERRRLACEMLMYIEDGAQPAVPRIAELLRDEEVEVRRAAALALGRLGTPYVIPQLAAALDDADWLVRFHAGAALEALTACAPGDLGAYGANGPAVPLSDEAAAVASAPEFFRRLLVEPAGRGSDDATPAEQLIRALRSRPLDVWYYQEHAIRGGISANVYDEGHVQVARRWPFAAARFGAEAPEEAREQVRGLLGGSPLPDAAATPGDPSARDDVLVVDALRAAGLMADEEAVALLASRLTDHENNYHAAEAAIALGRIGTPEAVAALWEAVRSEVPNRQVYISRYLQHGPRPEEYALLRGLVIAGAAPAVGDVHLLVAMLPGTFTEKPRFEDRMRPESQRVLLVRRLLENAGLREAVVEMLVAVLAEDQAGGTAGLPSSGGEGEAPAEPGTIREGAMHASYVDADSPLYREVLAGINLERPFSEHGREFPVVERIEPEQALWLLGCLAAGDRSGCEAMAVPVELVVPYLTSDNHRERIDAAVLLAVMGFGEVEAVAASTTDVLLREASEPYAFSELESIGKGAPFTEFRDHAYMVLALARHIGDVERLRPLADARTMYRDIRYALAVGLGQRRWPGQSGGWPGESAACPGDGLPLLVELATRDPIALVRREARLSIDAVQQTLRLAGEEVPTIEVPAEEPYEGLYPPRNDLVWQPVVVPTPSPVADPPETLEEIAAAVESGLDPANYRNLNNAQANGAERVMIRGVAEFDAAARALEQSGPGGDLLLARMLDSPYPFAHYLALRTISRRPSEARRAMVVERFASFAPSAERTVAFYWACEALVSFDDPELAALLAPYAQAENPAGVMGPAGYGAGYPAARAMARIAGDAEHPEVRRLLESDNVWLRAGAERGLEEAR